MLQLVERARALLNFRKAIQKVALLKADHRGVAAIEFALFAGFLSVAALQVADIGIYVYQRMQVENATEMGAQAAWQTCNTFTMWPASINCSNLNSAVQTAVQVTTLGNRVTLQAGSPSEGWYCVNSSNALQLVSSDMTTKPADCTAAGMPGLQAADYIQVTAKFSYAPLFPGITVAKAFTTPIIKTSLMRLH